MNSLKKNNRYMSKGMKFIELGRIHIGGKKVCQLTSNRADRRPLRRVKADRSQAGGRQCHCCVCKEVDQFFHTGIMRDDKQRIDSIRSVLYMLY